MTTTTTPLDPEDTTMLRILIVCAVLVAANACLFAMFYLLDRREEKRQQAERDAAELRRKLTAPHRPARTERLRAGPRYEYTPVVRWICTGCDFATWRQVDALTHWQQTRHKWRVRVMPAPRGLDDVTVDDGRTERVRTMDGAA